jgi:3-oxoacyl-[acyl-carrier protein] reductase
MFRDSGIGGKIVLVTGGSRGIGREIVRLLASEGADVTFLYRADKDAAWVVESGCRKEGLKVTALQVDVRDPRACEEAVEAVLERTERIDILVNNSGVVRDNLLASLSDEELGDVLETNVEGIFHMTRAVAPAMLRQREGSIINIGSVSGLKGGRGQVAYAASKGAVDAFTRALAVELAPRGVRVNAVAPGVIETEMSEEVRELAGEETLQRILLKRYGTPAEVAYAVCFLASRYAGYINGEILRVDGGFKMS